MLSTHSARLERWLGSGIAEGIAKQTHGWYGPPIPIAGVPGKVYVTGHGDFVGPIRGGYYGNMVDYGIEKAKRIMRNWSKEQEYKFHAGFASLSDLISEATTGGKSQLIPYQVTGVAGPAATSSAFLWAQMSLPSGAGSNAAAAGGGTIPDNTTAGGLKQNDPTGGDTLHLTTWTGTAGTAVGALMLFDYLFGVNNSLNNTNTAVTGVPTRYQDTTAAGSFVSARVTTVLSATGTNLTVTYMDQAGNTAEAATAVAARTSAAVQTIPLTQPLWYIPLNSGDTGLRKITNVQSSGANSGVVDWTIGHPLAILPMQQVNVPFVLDGINSAFNLVEVKTDACLAFLEYFKSATGAATYTGMIQLVSG